MVYEIPGILYIFFSFRKFTIEYISLQLSIVINFIKTNGCKRLV